MSPEEQQQVNAAMRFLEQQVANIAREGANANLVAEALAMKLKTAEEKIAALEEDIAKQAEAKPDTKGKAKP